MASPEKRPMSGEDEPAAKRSRDVVEEDEDQVEGSDTENLGQDHEEVSLPDSEEYQGSESGDKVEMVRLEMDEVEKQALDDFQKMNERMTNRTVYDENVELFNRILLDKYSRTRNDNLHEGNDMVNEEDLDEGSRQVIQVNGQVYLHPDSMTYDQRRNNVWHFCLRHILHIKDNFNEVSAEIDQKHAKEADARRDRLERLRQEELEELQQYGMEGEEGNPENLQGQEEEEEEILDFKFPVDYEESLALIMTTTRPPPVNQVEPYEDYQLRRRATLFELANEYTATIRDQESRPGYQHEFGEMFPFHMSYDMIEYICVSMVELGLDFDHIRNAFKWIYPEATSQSEGFQHVIEKCFLIEERKFAGYITTQIENDQPLLDRDEFVVYYVYDEMTRFMNFSFEKFVAKRGREVRQRLCNYQDGVLPGDAIIFAQDGAQAN